jgi:hypothetical protein
MDLGACADAVRAALASFPALQRRTAQLDVRFEAPLHPDSAAAATGISATAANCNNTVSATAGSQAMTDVAANPTAVVASAAPAPARPVVYVRCVLAAQVEAAAPAHAASAAAAGIAASTMDDSGGRVRSTARDAADAASSTNDLPAGGRGCFTHPPSLVRIFADRVATAADVAQLLTHELTHATDQLVHGMDLATCGQLACSELRAAAFAECADRWPAAVRRRCIRDTAWVSTDMVFKGVGGRCVDAVLAWCVDSDPATNPAAVGTPLHAAIEAERQQLRTVEAGSAAAAAAQAPAAAAPRAPPSAAAALR